MNNKVKFLRGTSNEYAVAEKDSDTIYFTTDDGKLYIGDKEVSGSDVTIDDTLSDTSTNPVQNKVVKHAIDNKADKTVATTSANGLMSAEDKTKLDDADNTYALKSKYGDTTINVGRKADTTVGVYSTAEGRDTTASGDYSHAEGYNTIASGNFSHAEGYKTTASGDYSHAEGSDTTASSMGSHAEGKNTTASGGYSHAGGIGTKALHSSEVAYGKYNESNSDTLFSIGDGTNDDARHNAFEITKTGGKLHDKDIAVDVSNPNLLISPDFKINQRGVSGTFSETGKYFVDRWRLVSGAVTVNADGTLTLNGTISQIFENAVGDNVTASVSAGTATYDDSTKTFSIVGNNAVLNWAKLEYGSVATPFIPPDTATELLKCERFFRTFDSHFVLNTIGSFHHNANNQFVYIFDTPMRVAPNLIFTDCVVRRVSEPYVDVSVTSFNSLSTKRALYIYCEMDTLYDDAIFMAKSDNGLTADAEIY